MIMDIAKTESGTADRGEWRALEASFDDVVTRLPDVLAVEGFGVISQIDLQATFKAKLGVDFKRYRIFGACNPHAALEAVTADPQIGLLLPCNVVVYERAGGGAMLGIIDPIQQLGVTHGPLAEVARNIRERLARVVVALDTKRVRANCCSSRTDT